MALYKKRLAAPSATDKNWIHYTLGGYNYCIQIPGTGGSTLPNCVGYAWGRWREILGKFHELSRGNAEVWWGKKDGYERSQTPRLGSVACWRKGSANMATDGAGHVAIVEEIHADGSITISNSDYGGTRFYTKKLKKGFALAGLTFQGFIHLPGTWAEEKPNRKTNEEIAKEVNNGDWGNGQERKNRLTAAGYDYNAIQTIVNKGAGTTPPPKPNRKTNEEIAKEVNNGDWGNGQERKNRLTAAGYDYNAIQTIVNKGAGTTPPPKPNRKTNEEIAKEVNNGDWGNGQERKNRLTAAGYDYNAIQTIVNKGASTGKVFAGTVIKMGNGTVLRDSKGNGYSLVLKFNTSAKVLSQIGDGINGNTLLRFKAPWLIGVTEAYVYLKDVKF